MPRHGRAIVTHRESVIAARVSGRGEPLAPRQGSARSLLDHLGSRTIAPDYGARIDALKRDANEFGVDPFGVDADWVRGVGLLAGWLYRYYFRVQTRGIESVPPGRAMIVANHSGQMPFDGAMIAAAMLLEGDPPRLARTMVERWSETLPYVSVLFRRTGQVLGLPENARRLLEMDHPLIVFPEGIAGANKTFDKAYQLQEFGFGFMRLALETATPIVPVAVIGAEEQYPAIYNVRSLAKVLGAPAVPITPLMIVPVLGLLPLPTRYRLYFGRPMRFSGDSDDDDDVIAEKVSLVRSTVQSMVNRGVREREHVFW